MHAALRAQLGAHVQQKGSLVAPDRLRFDFSHHQPLSAEELKEVERLVNTEIQMNSEVGVELLSYEEAISKGAMALFGEKYGSEVRVLTMGGGYSVELCGGTHVSQTGEIGMFRIVSESGIAAGVRRIDAVTGPGGMAWCDEADRLLGDIGDLVRGGRSEVVDKVSGLVEENRKLTKQLVQLQREFASSQGADLADQAIEVSDVKLLTARIEGDGKALMQTLDDLRSRLGRAVIVLGQVASGKVSLAVGVSKDLTELVKAQDLVNAIGEQVGAKGGGRPDMARAGGGDRPQELDAALESVESWLRERLD